MPARSCASARRASCIATGSCTRSDAPRETSSRASTRDGASRMSSVLGLNARPQIAKVRPLRSSPKRRTTLSPSTRFCASLTASTASSTRIALPLAAAVRISACTSLGKHEPP